MTATVHGFQTQVTKLLDLLANSLYSNKEVFLRELISNDIDTGIPVSDLRSASHEGPV